jgi:hypothetical protein
MEVTASDTSDFVTTGSAEEVEYALASDKKEALGEHRLLDIGRSLSLVELSGRQLAARPGDVCEGKAKEVGLGPPWRPMADRKVRG